MAVTPQKHEPNRISGQNPGARVTPLSQPVSSLWGVGSERAIQLARLRIVTVEDLLLHRPRRYEDRRRFRPIGELVLDEPATTRGVVVAQGLKKFRHGSKSVFEMILEDGTGRLHCRWWNLPYMEKYFKPGDEVVVYGKPLSLKPRTIDHPETEVVEGGEESFIHVNRWTPVYPLTEGLPQRWLRGLMWRTLERYESAVAEPWPRVPPPLLAGAGSPPFPPRAGAIRMLHFPEAAEDIALARRRLALDEFTELLLGILRRRKIFESRARALPCGGDNRIVRPFLASLGFRLTEAQTRVLREIRSDLRGAHPMRRLLQGDVGSGKTLVAACSAAMALESGYGVLLMAPTEILAEQHHRNFSNWFGPLGVRVELYTGSSKPDRAGSTNGPVLAVGTHALLSAGVELPKLGLVIIDEQHKFGVAQREQLVRKGQYPHLLVMTATPIPRTLGLTLYGELDVSVLDEMPKGRGRVKTFVRGSDTLPKVWEFVREQLAQGRQAYVVYPRVEDTGAPGAKAVLKEFEGLQRRLAPHKVGLLYGKMRAREKEDVMAAFRSNALQVLLSTSLIEVGVDVPNATLMVVENAEQFGLAQLHQLRGRIGRGAADAWCVLVSDAGQPEARERLRTLERTSDGFVIAEADLKMRGPGDFLGRDQSGLPDLRFGDLAEDGDLVRLARGRAGEVLMVGS
ncbi:MAG: ATP-dependent DNA helicase RecG [Verrucomicrobiota bacterium]